jgi:subtilisin family serine protease
VVDTGVGPHPYLTQVQSIGSFVNGKHDASPQAGRDVEDHGTHVSGIINARPPASSGDFIGIAPKADVFMARVFPDKAESQAGSNGANQGDIANALDALSTNQVDLINLSLGGPTPSQIELDAIQAAIEAGALVICAAGNGNGSPVMYPAAYPQTVAVSAIGVLGVVPVGSLAAASLPTLPDRFTPLGLYLANFSNIGPQVSCTGPGVGIISTVPGRKATDAAYADMSGTSMATPAVCARLAVLLGNDRAYRNSPRDASRALRAWMTLIQNLYRVGLDSTYEGGGIPYGWTQ